MTKTKKDLSIKTDLPSKFSKKVGNKIIPEIDFDKKKYEGAKRMIEAAMRNVERVANYIEKMEQEERKEYYKNIPGMEGTFDGEYLISDDGKKKKVPVNYAAKSRLVFGDRMKVFEDGARDLFKQIDRVERKKIEGILTKKGGKWHILSDTGSYKISDTAAEFSDAQLNDEAEAYIPADNLKAPFATLERVIKKSSPADLPTQAEVKVGKLVSGKEKEEPKRKVTSRKPKSKPKGSLRTATKKPPFIRKTTKTTRKPPKKVEPVEKEYVADILDDDDLR